MCIAVVGGMKRLEGTYVAEAERLGAQVRVWNAPRRDLGGRLQSVDAVVVFTDRVSHSARDGAVRAARRLGIPVRYSRSCGVCAFRRCVRCLMGEVRRSSPEGGEP